MILDGIWKEFLNIVRQEAGSRVVETWLKAVSINHWDDAKKIIYIQTPNKFVKDWISKNYLKIFEDNLKRLFNVSEVTIKFLDIYSDTEKDIAAVETMGSLDVAPGKSKSSYLAKKNYKSKQEISLLPARRISGFVNEYYTFDNFIVGPNNSMAYAAARAVAEKPGRLYNPLFIYGGSGLGKTHLLNAIGNAIKEWHKDLWVLYQPADHFVTEFINAIRFDKIHLFQEKYKTVDVLLVDDIQFMANKDQTQETFFHIFNFLYESGKQIVFSSDLYPSDIQGMAKRLKSRFESGFVTDVKKPSVETKVAILKKKAEAQHQVITDDVIFYVASRYSSIRELEGALVRVIAYSNLSGETINLDLAKKILFKNQAVSQNLSLDIIAGCVVKRYSCSLGDLKCNKKTKELSQIRQICMYLMKKLSDKSFRDIGDFLGKKDHTTVVHGFQKIDQLRDTDSELDIMLKGIEEDILSTH